MFRAVISPIFRSIRLCDTACGIMHPICGWPVVWKGRNLIVASSWLYSLLFIAMMHGQTNIKLKKKKENCDCSGSNNVTI
jgi:hypothetical protein